MRGENEGRCGWVEEAVNGDGMDDEIGMKVTGSDDVTVCSSPDRLLLTQCYFVSGRSPSRLEAATK
jgi:hypothetical protein